MKKKLVGFGSLGAITVPIIMLVSCGKANKSNEQKDVNEIRSIFTDNIDRIETSKSIKKSDARKYWFK